MEDSDFYPRPPRGGRRRAIDLEGASDANFYPRPPRGGRQELIREAWAQGYISIHVLREEDDGSFVRSARQYSPFLSTSSARRTTSMARALSQQHC